MSIYFSFTMKPKKKLFKKNKIDFPAIKAALKSMEKEEQLHLEPSAKDVKVTLCQEGDLWITYKEGSNRLSGDCQTSMAGPGFHAAAIELLDKLADKFHLKLAVEDDTGYFKHRDFEKLRREHFYPWLKYIGELACEQYDKTDFKICWNNDSYSPKVIPGTVVTPIRRFTIEEIRQFLSQEPEVFAKDFFIWNEKRKDALFYRNSALVQMNTKCYFMFSDRSLWDGVENAVCIQLLETALQYDCMLPFPKREYSLLCRLHEKDPMSIESVPEFRHECEIGYRRQEVLHQIGPFTYSAYGCCLEKYNRERNTLLYYDERPGNWHTIQVTLFQMDSSEAVFSTELFGGENVAEVLTFPVGDGSCKLAVLKPEPMKNSPEGLYYEMAGQIILDSRLLLVTQTYCREEEKSEILDWFHRIDAKRRKSIK